jgi:hypothetical protein
MSAMLEHMKDKISNDESFVPAGIFAAMEKVTQGEAALQAKDAALQQVEEENAQMRERESSLKQQLATAEEKARIGAELEQQLHDERKKQKIMEVSAVVNSEKAVFLPSRLLKIVTLSHRRSVWQNSKKRSRLRGLAPRQVSKRKPSCSGRYHDPR